MLTQNLHTHTAFDDGKASPMERAQAALNAGLTGLGFSAHSTLPYENDWCLTDDTLPAYLAEVARVRDAFRDRLAIYSGLELDGISAQNTDGFDYVIGSLHHITVAGEYPSIDYTAPITRDALDQYFHGDARAMTAAYFAQYEAMANDPRIHIVGHFDLITKFSQTDGLFDPHDPFLLSCAIKAMEPLVSAGKIFEVNTGAMARGLRSEPYPSIPLLRRLCDMGGKVTVTSDAHSPDVVTHAFRDMEQLLKDIGFREVWTYDGTGFVPSEIA